MTIKKGETVIVSDKTNRSRWKGSVNNKEGMFPSWVLRKGLKRPSRTRSSLGDTAKKRSGVDPYTQYKKSNVQTLRSVSQNGKADDVSPSQSPSVQSSGHQDPPSVSSGLGEKA